MMMKVMMKMKKMKVVMKKMIRMVMKKMMKVVMTVDKMDSLGLIMYSLSV